jgi:hypothetical protein
MINEKAQNLINEIKQILASDYVNKDEIQKGFDKYFDLLKLPRRKVEICENLKDWGVAWDAVWYADWDTAWYATRYKAWNAARNATRDMIWNATRDVAWDATRDAAWNAARDAAWDAAWNAACLNSCDKNDDCKICEFRRKFCEPEFNLFKNGLFVYWISKDKVIAIIRPHIRYFNNRLHSEVQPAIEWPNEKYYFLWGVKLDKKLWQKIVNKKMSFKEIMTLENIEQRMVALKMMDIQKLLAESNAKLLHKSARGNELYLVKNVFNRPAYFLKYQCPSTGRMYISGIDPQIAQQNPNADYCQAWKMGITLDDYLKNIAIET